MKVRTLAAANDLPLPDGARQVALSSHCPSAIRSPPHPWGAQQHVGCARRSCGDYGRTSEARIALLTRQPAVVKCFGAVPERIANRSSQASEMSEARITPVMTLDPVNRNQRWVDALDHMPSYRRSKRLVCRARRRYFRGGAWPATEYDKIRLAAGRGIRARSAEGLKRFCTNEHLRGKAWQPAPGAETPGRWPRNYPSRPLYGRRQTSCAATWMRPNTSMSRSALYS
jgi:hypothetical protein